MGATLVREISRRLATPTALRRFRGRATLRFGSFGGGRFRGCAYGILDRHFPIEIEVFGGVDRFQTQAETALADVDLDNAQDEFIAAFDHFARMCDALGRELGDVDQALDGLIVNQAGEGAKLGQFGDAAAHELATAQGGRDFVPGVANDTAAAQADAFRRDVDADDFDLDLVANTDGLTRVGDMPPSQLGNVDQAFAAADIDEGTEVFEADDRPFADFTDLQFRDEVFFASLSDIALGGAFGENEAIALAVDLHHLQADRLIDHRTVAFFRCFPAHAADALFRQLALRDKTAQPPKADDQPAFVVAADLRLVDFFGFGIFSGVTPVELFERVVDRKDCFAAMIARVDDIDSDFGTDGQSFEHLARHQFQFSAGYEALVAITEVNVHGGRRCLANHALINPTPFVLRFFFCRRRGFCCLRLFGRRAVRNRRIG